MTSVYDLPHSREYPIVVPAGTTIVCAEPVCDAWCLKDLLGKMPVSVEYLDLSHDGVITVEKQGHSSRATAPEETKAVIVELISSMPNLRQIAYCGYYCGFEEELIEVVKGYPNINLVKAKKQTRPVFY
jgi:hypothetical protein